MLRRLYNRKTVPRAFGLTDIGCVRKRNEDRFLLKPELGLYLVADGMGGVCGGELASRIAVESVEEYIAAAKIRNEDTFRDAFDSANDSIRMAAVKEPSLKGMGTTMVGLLQCGEEWVICNVGDSRAYLCSGGGLEQITKDHTWVNLVGRPLGLTTDVLRRHPMRHVLVMAVGVTDSLMVDAFPLNPKPGDRLLLCSDGLHGVVLEENIAETLVEERGLEDCCHLLIKAARNAGGPDNITAVVVDF